MPLQNLGAQGGYQLLFGFLELEAIREKVKSMPCGGETHEEQSEFLTIASGQADESGPYCSRWVAEDFTVRCRQLEQPKDLITRKTPFGGLLVNIEDFPE